MSKILFRINCVWMVGLCLAFLMFFCPNSVYGETLQNSTFGVVPETEVPTDDPFLGSQRSGDVTNGNNVINHLMGQTLLPFSDDGSGLPANEDVTLEAGTSLEWTDDEISLQGSILGSARSTNELMDVAAAETSPIRESVDALLDISEEEFDLFMQDPTVYWLLPHQYGDYQDLIAEASENEAVEVPLPNLRPFLERALLKMSEDNPGEYEAMMEGGSIHKILISDEMENKTSASGMAIWSHNLVILPSYVFENWATDTFSEHPLASTLLHEGRHLLNKDGDLFDLDWVEESYLRTLTPEEIERRQRLDALDEESAYFLALDYRLSHEDSSPQWNKAFEFMFTSHIRDNNYSGYFSKWATMGYDPYLRHPSYQFTELKPDQSSWNVFRKDHTLLNLDLKARLDGKSLEWIDVKPVYAWGKKAFELTYVVDGERTEIAWAPFSNSPQQVDEMYESAKRSDPENPDALRIVESLDGNLKWLVQEQPDLPQGWSPFGLSEEEETDQLQAGLGESRQNAYQNFEDQIESFLPFLTPQFEVYDTSHEMTFKGTQYRRLPHEISFSLEWNGISFGGESIEDATLNVLNWETVEYDEVPLPEDPLDQIQYQAFAKTGWYYTQLAQRLEQKEENPDLQLFLSPDEASVLQEWGMEIPVLENAKWVRFDLTRYITGMDLVELSDYLGFLDVAKGNLELSIEQRKRMASLLPDAIHSFIEGLEV